MDPGDDPSTGLQYDQARFYDPTTGSFLTRDPLEAIIGQPYIYAADDPTSRTDPTGLISIGFNPTAGLDALVNIGRGASFGLTDTIANWISPGASCTVPQNTADELLGSAASGVVTGELVGKLAQGIAAEGGTEIVNRYMSQAELEANQETGLVRDGRAGTHFVTNDSYSTAAEAQSRLPLPTEPDVVAQMEVPTGAFSELSGGAGKRISRWRY